MVGGQGRTASKIKHEKDLGKATVDNCGVRQRRTRFIRLGVPEVQGHQSFKKAGEGALYELHFKTSTSQRICLALHSPSTDGENGGKADRKRGSRCRRGGLGGLEKEKGTDQIVE